MSEQSARAALAEALKALLEQGQVVEVSPTQHELSTSDLFDLAEKVREGASMTVNIEWHDNGSLTFAVAPSL